MSTPLLEIDGIEVTVPAGTSLMSAVSSCVASEGSMLKTRSRRVAGAGGENAGGPGGVERVDVTGAYVTTGATRCAVSCKAERACAPACTLVTSCPRRVCPYRAVAGRPTFCAGHGWRSPAQRSTRPRGPLFRNEAL